LWSEKKEREVKRGFPFLFNEELKMKNKKLKMNELVASLLIIYS